LAVHLDPSDSKMSFLEIQRPILVNWNGDLFVAGEEFFDDWKIRHEGKRFISYPQSAQGNKPLRWIITRDAKLLRFHEDSVMNKWATPP
jgi:hypothetical protein